MAERLLAGGLALTVHDIRAEAMSPLVAQGARAARGVAELLERCEIVCIALPNPGTVRGKCVLVVDDGPTLTHGGAPYGAGYVAAMAGGAAEVIDPRESAVGKLADVYRRYPHIGRALPAMGYSDAELHDLHATIATSRAEVVVCGTPIDLGHVISVEKPILRARYEFEEAGEPRLMDIVVERVVSTIARKDAAK